MLLQQVKNLHIGKTYSSAAFSEKLKKRIAEANKVSNENGTQSNEVGFENDDPIVGSVVQVRK